MARTFWVETLGCPKNQVDSDKLAGTLLAEGMAAAPAPEDADLVVVNTCAFVEEARAESIETILALGDARRPGAQLVVTGCLAERYGQELAAELPEADAVVGFGVPVTIGTKPATPSLDLLNLPRPPAAAPWAYVKVAEGCDRSCGFCAIPSFRGRQRSRTLDEVLAEIDALEVREVVLVAQDLASYGRDQGRGRKQLVPLVREAARRVDWVRLLYLYPAELSDELIDTIVATGVPYFDLSLQHVSAPLLRRMRRWGDARRFLERIDRIRRSEPAAALRTNFIVGYPGETEADHDALLAFVEQAQLDWCGFFAFSREEGTYAVGLDGEVPASLVAERLAELRELQDAIMATKRDELLGSRVEVLVEAPGRARSYREAPEIDGVIAVPSHLPVGVFAEVEITGAAGPDLEAVPVGAPAPAGVAGGGAGP
ncbi:30S ribosomal protein S12 methylthiotransferase RimO [Rhabdothermincola sediminis]|uniref:30S ribosomal protein S12 methylthiotransferase RimO n=1 Tax=Rhabdothermincola sediminis TaxID=2751370 RepID=UPI001AA0517C|nr:30S ribosomal protein S12 methylthiotransferase RimO [Rhabdothermincola sediminis]